MAKAKLNLFSIVLVGRQNPQILNHDFLVRNRVLPEQEPFFRKDLKDGEQPFTDFVSVPPFARIAYRSFSLIVQEDRYQALDESGGDPQASPIVTITKRYFGDLLRFTPFKIGGMNLSYELAFNSVQEEHAVDAAIGVSYENAKRAFDSPSVIAGLTAEFTFLNGQMSIAMAKPRSPDQPVRMNFNYEFGFPGEMGVFLLHLDKIGDILGYQATFFQRLGILE